MNRGFLKLLPEGHWRLVFITLLTVGHLLLATTAYSKRADTCAGAESRLLAATKALDQGTLDEARRIFLEVQASHTQCADVLLGLGRIHAAQGDAGPAYKLLSRYTKLAAEDHEGYYHLARYLLSQGNDKGAEAQLERAISLNPDSAASLMLLGPDSVETGTTYEGGGVSGESL